MSISQHDHLNSDSGAAGLCQQRFLRRMQAAAYVRERWGIPCATSFLAKLAVTGGGPVFRKAGRHPIYAPDDLDAWAQSRISRPLRSTSDLVGTVR